METLNTSQLEYSALLYKLKGRRQSAAEPRNYERNSILQSHVAFATSSSRDPFIRRSLSVSVPKTARRQSLDIQKIYRNKAPVKQGRNYGSLL